MVIDGIPGAAFVLEIVAVFTVVGTSYAHLRHQRDRSFDVERAVANYSLTGLVTASALQVLSVLAR